MPHNNPNSEILKELTRSFIWYSEYEQNPFFKYNLYDSVEVFTLKLHQTIDKARGIIVDLASDEAFIKELLAFQKCFRDVPDSDSDFHFYINSRTEYWSEDKSEWKTEDDERSNIVPEPFLFKMGQKFVNAHRIELQGFIDELLKKRTELENLKTLKNNKPNLKPIKLKKGLSKSAFSILLKGLIQETADKTNNQEDVAETLSNAFANNNRQKFGPENLLKSIYQENPNTTKNHIEDALQIVQDVQHRLKALRDSY